MNYISSYDYEKQDIETFDRFLESCTPEERKWIDDYLEEIYRRFKKRTTKQRFSKNCAKHIIMRVFAFLDERPGRYRRVS